MKGIIIVAGDRHLSRYDWPRLTLQVPNDAIVRLFEESVSYNFHQVKMLLDQNRLLTQARDLLLPRLMNGTVGRGMTELETANG